MAAQLVRLGDVATISQGMTTSGRGAGAREGTWELRVASVGDIQDDRLEPGGLKSALVEFNVKTEKHLLRPEDVLVAARSTVVKAALVPPALTRTVADATLLVVRPLQVDGGPYLWWFLTSSYGRRQVQARMASSTTLLSLSVAALADLAIPWPDQSELYRIAELVEVSERAYAAAAEAARLRRTIFRDAIVGRLSGAKHLSGASYPCVEAGDREVRLCP